MVELCNNIGNNTLNERLKLYNSRKEQRGIGVYILNPDDIRKFPS